MCNIITVILWIIWTMLESAIKEHPFFTRITAFLNTVAILGWCVGRHHSMHKNCMLYCTLSMYTNKYYEAYIVDVFMCSGDRERGKLIL